MIDNTETTVLMKCSRCEHIEHVPSWILDELEASPTKIHTIYCPKCDHLMYEPHVLETLPKRKPKPIKKRWKKK